MCWEKVREGGEEGEVTCCSRESSSQKQSAQSQGRGDHDRSLLNTNNKINTCSHTCSLYM